MHDVYYMNVPQDLQNLFTRTARVGRRKQNFNVVRCKTEKGRTFLRYTEVLQHGTNLIMTLRR
jgi:hypothetical protein